MPPPLPQIDGVEHHHVSARGVRLHYAEAGEGVPLVAVHGAPQNWWIWRNQIASFAAAGYRVICPDLRGYGWSEKPPRGYRKEELMLDVLALLDELGIERTHWVGHDFGAYTGMLAALSHPDRIERFVALSIPHPWGRTRFDPRLAASTWYQFVLASPLLGRLVIEQLRFPRLMLTKGRVVGSYTDEELSVYESTLREPGATEALTQTYRTLVVHELPGWVGGAFREMRLTVPTLWMVGDADPVAKHADDGIRDHADDATFVRVPGAGHFLPEEMPDLVVERTLEHLSAVG
jgi:pimeloyl-ACP methyl ester carboxylesterase